MYVGSPATVLLKAILPSVYRLSCTCCVCDSESSVSERELQAAEDQSQVAGHGPAAAARAHPRRLHTPTVHHRRHQATASGTAV